MTCQHLFPSPNPNEHCVRCYQRADAVDHPFTEVLATVRLLAGAVGAAPPGYPSHTELPATGSRVDRVRGAAPIGPAGTTRRTPLTGPDPVIPPRRPLHGGPAGPPFPAA